MFISFLQNVSIFFFQDSTAIIYSLREKEPLSSLRRRRVQRSNNNNNMRRRPRKNPHPKRAVNARTVLKARGKEEPLVFVCSRIPDEEDDLEANHHQIQKEEEDEEGEEEGEEADEDVKQLWRIYVRAV